MRKSLKELINVMDFRGLSTTKFTRVERTDGKQIAPSYTPASDIVNLFPALLSAAINDLEGSEPDYKVDDIAAVFLKQLIPLLYEAMPDKEGNYGELVTKVSRKLKQLSEDYPEAIRNIEHNFLFFSLIAYAIGCKNGLRCMPSAMGGTGVFRYFAMLAVWDKLSEETQKAVVTELAEQNLWGADPDAL